MGIAQCLRTVALGVAILLTPSMSWNQTPSFNISARHTKIVYDLAGSPDGRFLASFGADQRIKIWDQISGAVIREWEYPHADTPVLLFDPDGRQLVTAYGGDVSFWDFREGTLEESLSLSAATLTDLVYSTTGEKLLTADEDGLVQVTDLATGRVVREFGLKEDYGIAITNLALSVDGRSLFAAREDGFVDQWYWERGKIVYRFGKRGPGYRCLAISADGSYLAAGTADNWLQIWDIDSGDLDTEYEETAIEIRQMAFLPDSRQLLLAGFQGGYDARLHLGQSPANGFVGLWNAGTQAFAWKKSTDKAVMDFAFAGPGGQVFLGGDSPEFQVLSPATGAISDGFGQFANTIGTLAVHPLTGDLLVGGEDSQLKVVDPETGGVRAVLPPVAEGAITAVGLHPGYDRLITAHGPVLQVWQTDSLFNWFEPVHQFETGAGVIEKIFFTNGEEEIMLVRRDRHVAFDTEHFADDPYAHFGHGFSVPEQRVDKSRAASIEVWNYGAGEQTGKISDYNGYGYEVQFNRENGLLVCANRYHEVVHINWEESTLLGDFPLHKKAIMVGVMSPDRSLFFSGGFDKVGWIWDLDAMQVKEVPGMEGPITAAAISQDNNLLVTLAGTQLRVLDLSELRVVAERSLAEPVLEVLFSPGDDRLYGRNLRGELLTWDTFNWYEVSRMAIIDRADFAVIFGENRFEGTGAALDFVGLSPALAARTYATPEPVSAEMFSFLDPNEDPSARAAFTPTDSSGFAGEPVWPKSIDEPGMVSAWPDNAEESHTEENKQVSEPDKHLELTELMYVERFREAEKLATEMLYQDADDHQTRLLLTLACLYQDKFAKAKMIWFRFRQTGLGEGMTFSDGLSQNIHLFTQMGIESANANQFLNLIAPYTGLAASEE